MKINNYYEMIFVLSGVNDIARRTKSQHLVLKFKRIVNVTVLVLL